jgi:16S rRNA (cytidine1402-2'-O)-methyltransferase
MLYLVATPIGNLEDITYRAVRILGEADVLACEDTRRTRVLMERHAIKAPRIVVSYHEHNEERAGAALLAHLEAGRTVALVSDSGYPSISDPGYRLVSEARRRGLRVEVIPGAGAVATALVASGLPSSSYTFKGFPPTKSGPRRRFFEMERDQTHTLVVFESPRRLGKMLVDALDVLGDRQAAVCIELTKKFEEVAGGYLSDLRDRFLAETVRGEVTVVITGANPKFIRAAGATGAEPPAGGESV